MQNIAVVGTGNIARLHIEGYLAFPERCRIIALCDIAPDKCEKMKQKYPALGDAAVFASHKEMLDALRGRLGLVSLCLPPFQHAPIAIDCLQAGVNVLVEKPMASSLEECDAMIAAEKAGGKMLSCVAQNRFRDPIAGLKQVLDSGLAGKVTHVQVDSFWWRGHCYYDLWWRGKWDTEGGGCTLNHAVHHIDMLIWMLGLPETVTSVLSNAAHDNAEVEDVSVSVLRYPETSICAPGALAQITASVIHHGEEQGLIFQCEKARVSAPWKVHAGVSGPNGFPLPEPDRALEKALTERLQGIPPLRWTAHTGQIDDVLSALEQGRKPAIGSEDGRRTIELITAIYKAGSLGGTVKLPLTRDDPFYTAGGIMASVPHFYEKTASVEDFEGDITVGSAYKK